LLVPLERSHIAALKTTGESLHTILQATLLDLRQAHFAQGLIFGVLFLLIVWASLRITRLWCRSICPLGALLGAASRWSILGLQKDSSTCDKCNRCLLHCQGGDDPIGGVPWRKAECLMCMNCVGACPHASLQFRFFRKEREVATPDIGRRRALTGLAAGAAAVPLMRANTGMDKSRRERLLRPPGAVDENDFLSRCIRCGECMKVCPNNSLHPTLAEAGIEGLWTPTLVPRTGIASRVACCVLRCVRLARSGRSLPRRKAGWSELAPRISPFALVLRSTIEDGVCRGRLRLIALSAKSGVRFRQRPFMSKMLRLWTQQATRRCSSSRESVPADV
jgi:polyferredoxin